MTLTGGDIFSIKFHSAEAVRESLQQIWESCLPRRKVHRPIKAQENHYFLPDLSRPMFLRKREGDFLPSRLKNLRGLHKVGERQRKPTTHEVLYWRTCRKTENDS